MEKSFAILTVSDTAFAKEKVDTAGAALKKLIEEHFPNSTILTTILPDEAEKISLQLKQYAESSINVIFTTGGTGFSPRDVTPEATKAVIEKEAPGISLNLLLNSLKITKTAMLSRAVSGIRGNTLIINFPGSEKAVKECFEIVKPVLNHAISLITNNLVEVKADHDKIQLNEHSKVKTDRVAQRNRKSNYPMISVQAALNLIIDKCKNFEEETISVQSAFGRVLAEDIFSLSDFPHFPASIKDGYAVITSDGEGERTVLAATAAGDCPSFSLQKGQVVRISTGAAIPAGADAVVQVEDTELVKSSPDGSEELIIKILKAPSLNQDIRKIGSDISKGMKVIEKGAILEAAHLGVLAMLGYKKIKVFKKAKIGIISSGNELVSPNEPLKTGQIYDSNKIALINLYRQFGFNAIDYGIARDNPNETKSTLSKAFESCDIIVSTGGVSMGEFDLIKAVLLEDFKATIHFGRVDMKPGKPTTFATLDYNNSRKIIFALPGNPVSCCVTSILFVLPGLKIFENWKEYKFPELEVEVPNELINKDSRPEYVRVRLETDPDGKIKAFSTGNQISSRLNSLIGANALILVPGKSSIGGNQSKPKAILFGSIVNTR